MKNLPQIVRNKAIEIANALFKKRNMEEGRIIATAISHAKKMGKQSGTNDEKVSRKNKNKKKSN